MTIRKFLLLCTLIAAATVNYGCQATRPPAADDRGTQIGYYHDVLRHVSCWTYGNGGGSYTAAISCLPDSQVHP